MWEIRENTGRYDRDSHYGDRIGYRSGSKEKTMKEVYECGFEDGYKAAIEEMEEKSEYDKKYR